MDSYLFNQQYMATMRPVFNKKALYSDTTSNYVFPQEPTAYEEITIRFRTGRDNVDQAYMEWNGVSHLMTKVSHSEMFDFYEIQVQLENEPISYCFKVQSGEIIYYFDQLFHFKKTRPSSYAIRL